MGKDRLPPASHREGTDIPEKTPLTPEVVDNPSNLCACRGCSDCECIGGCGGDPLDFVEDPNLTPKALKTATIKSCRPRGSVTGGRKIS